MTAVANAGRNRNRCVPAHAFKRIIMQECADREITVGELERVLGYSEEAIRKKFRVSWVSFDSVDSILTRLGLFHLWYIDPDLQEVYEYLDSLPEKSREEQQAAAKKAYRKRNPKPRLTADCEFCGHRHKRKKSWNSKKFARFCSAKCQESAWKAAH